MKNLILLGAIAVTLAATGISHAEIKPESLARDWQGAKSVWLKAEECEMLGGTVENVGTLNCDSAKGCKTTDKDGVNHYACITEKVLTTVLVPSPVRASTPTSPGANASQKVVSANSMVMAPRQLTMDGSLSSVDLRNGTLKLISDHGVPVDVTITGAEVLNDGKKVSASSLKTGARVRINYFIRENRYIANSVSIINMN